MLEKDYVRYETAATKLGDATAPVVYFANMHAHPVELSFDAMASMSGSLWFPDWPAYMQKLCDAGAAHQAFDHRFAFFSIGSQERRSPPKILSTVQDRNEQAAVLLEAAGARSEFSLGPGNHFQHIAERCKKGLTALQDFLV